MRSSFRFFRPNRETDDAQMRIIRAAIESSVEVLRRFPVVPDTFLGRKTQEPFPQEADGEQGEEITSPPPAPLGVRPAPLKP